jgi:RNA polymerase-binding transcription factor DksA
MATKSVKKPAAKKPAPKKPAPKKIASKPVATKPAAKKSAPVAAKPVAAKPVATKPVATKPVATKPVATKVVASKPVATKPVATKPAPAPKKPAKPVFVKPPVPGKKPKTKDGIISNKDFDLAFLRAQRTLLETERARLLGQAERLENEREQLIEEAGMGDDQFDEDGGEGDTMAVERERDRVLSEQARQIVEDIDAALKRIETGDYGYSVISTRPIPRERLEVIPWATELVEERVGGIGRR